MSAVNPNAGDREAAEALRQAQRAHEPSMEEILTSIRNMIEEEREGDKAARPAGGRSAATAPQIVFSRDDPPSRVAQETPRNPAPLFSPEPGSAREEDLATPETKPFLRTTKPGPQSAGRAQAPGPEPLGLAGIEDEPLLSPEGGQAVTSAFEALSANLAAHGAEIARGLAREMLRPMLKTWLDENLPGIVERLVRAEIERVARGFP